MSDDARRQHGRISCQHKRWHGSLTKQLAAGKEYIHGKHVRNSSSAGEACHKLDISHLFTPTSGNCTPYTAPLDLHLDYSVDWVYLDHSVEENVSKQTKKSMTALATEWLKQPRLLTVDSWGKGTALFIATAQGHVRHAHRMLLVVLLLLLLIRARTR